MQRPRHAGTGAATRASCGRRAAMSSAKPHVTGCMEPKTWLCGQTDHRQQVIGQHAVKYPYTKNVAAVMYLDVQCTSVATAACRPSPERCCICWILLRTRRCIGPATVICRFRGSSHVCRCGDEAKWRVMCGAPFKQQLKPPRHTYCPPNGPSVSAAGEFMPADALCGTLAAQQKQQLCDGALSRCAFLRCPSTMPGGVIPTSWI